MAVDIGKELAPPSLFTDGLNDMRDAIVLVTMKDGSEVTGTLKRWDPVNKFLFLFGCLVEKKDHDTYYEKMVISREEIEGGKGVAISVKRTSSY